MKSVVIISGPVGAGKTAVAAELIAISPAPVAYIEGDTFWSFIAKPKTRGIKLDAFKMVMRAMLSASTHYAVAGYETILDFSIPPWFLNTARTVAKFREVPLDYVVLLPSEPVCAARAAARTEGTIKDYTYYHDLYKDFVGGDGYMSINDDHSDPAALAAQIRRELNKQAYRIDSPAAP